MIESLYACYEKDGKVYSCYQRNEVLQKHDDGTFTVRFKTAEEMETVRAQIAGTLQKAIDEGRAVRDRIGRIKWIKR